MSKQHNEIQQQEKEFLPLYQKLLAYISDEDIQHIYAAYLFAKAAHFGQYRATGEPYITHPLEAAILLSMLRLDPQCIMAALLHDVLEDTEVEKSIIAEKFGDEVAVLVDGVSKLTKIESASRAEMDAENFCKMIMAMGHDIRVILVKLADRLHNMRTISALRIGKRRFKGRETLEIYAPIANRLGIHKWYTEFNELGFNALYPMRYRVLQAATEKQFSSQHAIQEELSKAILAKFEKYNISIVRLDWRHHHFYSIYKEMREKHRPLDEILSSFLLRIIVPDQDSCYRTLGVMHNLYKPNLEQFRDYIAIPKANGYRALHTMLLARSTGRDAIRIELQIRSQAMHHLAEYGITAHWQKSIETGKPDLSQQRVKAWLNQLLEIHKGIGTPQEFVDTVKKDLFPHEVYVFTPKGKILELPEGSSPVDFAYMIHTDIGNSCVAAKVDRRMVPLSTVLSNGQTIEIIVSKTAKPNPDWLNFVTTAKARTNIRQSLKNIQRSEAIELGKNLLQSALHTFHQTLDAIDLHMIESACQRFASPTMDDLLEAIGLGNQMPMVIAQFLLGHFDSIGTTSSMPSIYIKGSEHIVVSFADCCHPIPGDPIVALMQPGLGIIVHAERCILLLNNPQMLEHAMPARWEENIKHDFKTQLLIDVRNQVGILAKTATAIAEANAGIEDIAFMTRSERCIQIQFLVAVSNRDHLARVLRKVRNVKDVLRVKRA